MLMMDTQHAHRRCAQRNLDAEALELVRRYGRRLHRTGAVFYFLGKRDIPEELRRDDRYARLEGTTLLFSLEGELITAYRNRQALRQIRKKDKRRLGPSKGWRNLLDYVRPAA